MTELEAGLEAVLFAAGDAVPVDRLAAALEAPRGAVLEAAAALENLYDFENRGLMLLRLERPVRLGRAVKPIAVANTCMSPGTPCLVSGWGTTSSPIGKYFRIWK